jgi:hypothetical protein
MFNCKPEQAGDASGKRGKDCASPAFRHGVGGASCRLVSMRFFGKDDFLGITGKPRRECA